MHLIELKKKKKEKKSQSHHSPKHEHMPAILGFSAEYHIIP